MSPTPMDELLRCMSSRALTDVLAPGWFDTDGPLKRFVPDRHSVYLDFDGQLVHCRWSQSTDFELHISLVEKVVLEVLDDSYGWGVVTLLGICLYEDRTRNHVTRFEAYARDEVHFQRGQVHCAGLDISGNSFLFLDGVAFQGTELGKRDERDAWFSDVPSRLQGVHRVWEKP